MQPELKSMVSRQLSIQIVLLWVTTECGTVLVPQQMRPAKLHLPRNGPQSDSVRRGRYQPNFYF
jgi:hypothetical protein